MTVVVAIAVSILPVFLFLGSLVLIDSYKLVALRAILLSISAGVVAALASYGVNVWLRPALDLDFIRYTMYVSPIVEESLKATFVIYLLRASKVGFAEDAAIHGFAIGTGFAFVENLYYIQVIADATLWTWIVRGFGTAIMHGGATAIFAWSPRHCTAASVPSDSTSCCPGSAWPWSCTRCTTTSCCTRSWQRR